MTYKQTSLAERKNQADAIKTGNPEHIEGVDNGNKGTSWWQDITDMITGKESQERDYLYNMSAMDEANAFTEHMYDRSIDMEEQLQKWLDAGGNPNAFFEQGGTGQGMSSTSPGSVGSTIGVSQGAMQQGINALTAYWQAQKTKAETEGIEINNGTLQEMNEATIKKIYQDIRLSVKEGNLKDQEAKQIEEMLPLLKGKTSAEIEQIEQQTVNLFAEWEEIEARIKLLDEQTKGQILDNYKKKWEKLFIEEYGADPNANWIAMIIQSVMSGHGSNTITQLFKFVREGMQTTSTESKSLATDIVTKILKSIGAGDTADLILTLMGKNKSKSEYEKRLEEWEREQEAGAVYHQEDWGKD